MGRPRKFNYDTIRKMAMDGFTAQEIAAEIGAQSAEHIKVLVRKKSMIDEIYKEHPELMEEPE